mmetsp:Transcript_18021/g.42113  ORF Transcript_18021/g.42113 Transcript_18021/m.42113 type:complete len:804 (+) Transcript_18021:192-2603(+)
MAPGHAEVVFPPMRLHSLHGTPELGGARPILVDELSQAGLESMPAKAQALQSFLRKTAKKGDEGTAAFVASFSARGLLIQPHSGHAQGTCPAGSALEVPLFFATVESLILGSTSATKAFLAVAASNDAGQNAGNVWLLVLDVDSNGLNAVLQACGQRGAVRGDLHKSFELKGTLGSGAYSTVRLATRNVANQESAESTAVKILTQQGVKAGASLGQEVQLLMKVQHHPNVIGFHGIFSFADPEEGCHSQSWALMLQHCAGGDLHTRLLREGVYSEVRACQVLHSLLSALAHVHSRGVVHRDVKAENVLLNGNVPVLCDFGIAACIDDEEAMKKRCGSPGCAAPEILTGRAYDEKVDVFSTGVLAYFILSRRMPFAGPDVSSILRRTVRCQVSFDHQRFTRISEHMLVYVQMLLHKHVEERPSSEKALDLTTSLLRSAKALAHLGHRSTKSREAPAEHVEAVQASPRHQKPRATLASPREHLPEIPKPTVRRSCTTPHQMEEEEAQSMQAPAGRPTFRRRIFLAPASESVSPSSDSPCTTARAADGDNSFSEERSTPADCDQSFLDLVSLPSDGATGLPGQIPLQSWKRKNSPPMGADEAAKLEDAVSTIDPCSSFGTYESPSFGSPTSSDAGGGSYYSERPSYRHRSSSKDKAVVGTSSTRSSKSGATLHPQGYYSENVGDGEIQDAYLTECSGEAAAKFNSGSCFWERMRKASKGSEPVRRHLSVEAPTKSNNKGSASFSVGLLRRLRLGISPRPSERCGAAEGEEHVGSSQREASTRGILRAMRFNKRQEALPCLPSAVVA